MIRLVRPLLLGGVVCGALVLTGVSESGSTRPLRYVALGDSFSAGEGVPPFRKGTNRYLPPRNRCHRSYRAYPALVAGRRSSPGIWGFWACSGARLRDLTSANDVNPGELAQLDRIALPGRSDSRVDLVTLTLGGNDAQFRQIWLPCFVKHAARILGSCHPDWRATIGLSIRRLRATLPPVYRALRARAPRARIIVLGYPNPFPTVAPVVSRCRRWFADDDLRWLSQTTMALNDAIRAATISSGARVTYLSPSGFEGHDVCSDAPWFDGLELLPLRTRYSFHPNVLGQRRLARIVLAAL
jgi:lysophospholipase L1-like esterase